MDFDGIQGIMLLCAYLISTIISLVAYLFYNKSNRKIILTNIFVIIYGRNHLLSSLLTKYLIIATTADAPNHIPKT